MPITGFNALYIENQSLNPEKQKAIDDAKTKDDLAERKMKVDEGQLAVLQSRARADASGGGAQVANIEIYNEWKRIKASGDEQGAEAFARANRLMPEWGQDAGTITSATVAKYDAKGAVKYKETLFDSINAGARTLNKYSFAIDQIDKGAESGPVMKLLPNLQEQTILVDVIRKEIGMEILGSGALGVNPTDKDVTLAMDSAIPENLSPKALKTELQRRASVLQDLNTAQEKYYELIESGKTKGDILKMAKTKREQSKQDSSNTNIQSLLDKY